MQIHLTVNGQQMTCEQEQTIQQLLDTLGRDPARVVVEKAGKILPREEFTTSLLADGDILEIVHFVGGG